MGKRKQYTITLSGQHLVGGLLKEFKYWGINPKSYTVDGAVITTQNKNAVDVVTETFMRYPNLVKIEAA